MAQQITNVLQRARTATIGVVGDRELEQRVHLATEAALAHVRGLLPFESAPTDAIVARLDERLLRYAARSRPGAPHPVMEELVAAARRGVR